MTEQTTRLLEVTGARDADQVTAYLPGNYQVTGTRTDDRGRLVVQVEGQDRAGWTAADYVIPRLASGLLWAQEVTPA